MKYLSKILVGIVCLAAFLVACDKADIVPTYKSGNTPILSSSATTIAASASDSDNTVIQFTWTNPTYATDSSTVKYILEFDTSASFATATSFTVTGALSDTLSGLQVNNLILNTYGLNIAVPYNFKARLVSSYANNNDQKISNTVALSLKAYVIPPKVAPPTSGTLFLIGDATSWGWNNPVPIAQQFDQIDSVTYGGVFNLSNTGGGYILLPVNGSYSTKYTVPDNTVSGIANGGSFQYYGLNVGGGDNIPAPATAGWYTIIVNFQTGKFTVTPFTSSYAGGLPSNLYVIGDATAGGWNDVPGLPQLTQLNSAVFTITMPLIAGGSGYLLLPTDVGDGSDFSNKYSVDTAPFSGGAFGFELPNNFPPPPVNGTYTITVNFATGLFTVK